MADVAVLEGGWDRWRELGYPVAPIAADEGAAIDARRFIHIRY